MNVVIEVPDRYDRNKEVEACAVRLRAAGFAADVSSYTFLSVTRKSMSVPIESVSDLFKIAHVLGPLVISDDEIKLMDDM